MELMFQGQLPTDSSLSVSPEGRTVRVSALDRRRCDTVSGPLGSVRKEPFPFRSLQRIGNPPAPTLGWEPYLSGLGFPSLAFL